MLPSTTLNFNAVGPINATDWRPVSQPHPGLRTRFNRGQWLSRPRTSNGTNWTLPDAWVDGCIKQGLEPLALLMGDPAEPYDPVVEGDYRKLLCQRYKGRVHFYEEGNEVDTEGSWLYDGNETGGATAGLAWRTSVDAFSMDPDVTVICGSIQSVWPGGHGMQTLANAFAKFGQWLPTDISIHLYPGPDQVDLVPAMIERVRGACFAHAKNEPRIWVTEWNLWDSVFSGMSAKDQGAFLRTMFRHLRDANVYQSLHYLFDDPNGYGFVDQKVGKAVWNDAMSSVFGKAANAWTAKA